MSRLLRSMRAHPYAWGSAACHLIVLGSLLSWDHFRKHDAQHAVLQRQVSASMQRAQHIHLQRQVQDMERIKQMLDSGDSAGNRAKDKAADAATARDTVKDVAKDSAMAPAELERRKRELAADIEKSLQKAKAQELAKLLNIPEKEALSKVQAARPTDKPQTLDELRAHAQEVEAFRRRQQEREGDGMKVAHGGQGQSERSGAAGNGEGKLKQGEGAPDPVRDRLAKDGTRVDTDSRRADILNGGDDAIRDTFSDTRFYGNDVSAPPVDAATLRAGAGRVFGSGGRFANRVYIDSWYLIGPFTAYGAESQQTVYPPEQAVDLDAVYFGKGGRALRWHWEQFSGYPLTPPDHEENAVYYGYTEVDMDRDRDLVLSLGADDDAKLWVNDELVWTSGNDFKPWYRQHFRYLTTSIATLNLTEASRRVHFHQGRNTVLFKLYNGIGATFFSLAMSN